MKTKLTVAFAMTVFTNAVGVLWSADQPIAAQKGIEAGTVFRGIRPEQVALSPCEKYLAAAGRQDGTDEVIGLLVVWDLQTKKEVFRYRTGARGLLNAVAFSPDGKLLAAGGGGAEKTAKIWQFPSGKEVARLENDENVHSLYFSPNGKFIAMASNNWMEHSHAMLLWDTAQLQKKSLFKAPNPIAYGGFSRDGRFLACADAGEHDKQSGKFDRAQVHIWDLKQGKKVADAVVGKDSLTAFCFAHESNQSATGGYDGRIYLLAEANAAKLDKPAPMVTGMLTAQDAGVCCLLFSANDKWLFSGGREFPPGKNIGGDGTVQVWNVAEKKLHVKFKAHDGRSVLTMAMTRDGQTLITASLDETVKVWSLPKGFYNKRKD